MSDASPQIVDATQRQAALNLSEHILVQAPAGSGKTGLLIQRMLAALATVDDPEAVVAVTFTRKAAGEIRERLLDALVLAEQPRPEVTHEQTTWDLATLVLQRDTERGWNLRRHPQRLRTMTLDAMNGELANRLPLTSGTGGPIQPSDDADELYVEALLSLFSQIDDPEQPTSLREALAAILRFSDNRLQRAINLVKPLLGKREQWQFELLGESSHRNFAEQSQAAITQLLMTRMQTADELLDAEWQQDVANCFAQAERDDLPPTLKENPCWPNIDIAQVNLWIWLASALLTKDGNLRKSFDKRSGFIAKQAHTIRIKELITEIWEHPQLDEIETALADLHTAPPANYPADSAQFGEQLVEVLRHAIAHLKVIFGRHGSADFVEIGQRAIAALNAPDDQSGANLKNRQRVAFGIQHLLVDEMQDTSASQMQLLLQLTQDWEENDGHSLFLVGDPMQSIYGFRQAEVRLFMELWQSKRLGHLPLSTLQLQSNFRSRPEVVEFCNKAFSALFPDQASLLNDAVPYTSATAIRAKSGASGLEIHALVDANKVTECEVTADAIRAILSQDSQASIAVLIRSRGHAVELLPALRDRNIPYSCQEIDALSGRAAITDALALTKALNHPMDQLSWGLMLRCPLVGLNWADLLALAQYRSVASWPEKLRVAATEMSATSSLSAVGLSKVKRVNELLSLAQKQIERGCRFDDVCQALWASLGGAHCVSSTDQEDLAAYWSLLNKHCTSGLLEKPFVFEQQVASLYASSRPGNVQIMTIHKAKGLEFDHCFLFGCNRKPKGEDQEVLQYRRLPQGYLIAPKVGHQTTSPEAAQLYNSLHDLHKRVRAQERLRLLYVGATRARECLHIVANYPRNSKGEPAASKGSFGEDLFPWVREKFQESSMAPTVAPSYQPMAVQQKATWAFPETPMFAVSQRISSSPSQLSGESALTTRPSPTPKTAASEQDESAAILAGTIYHQAMERIANEGLERWPQIDQTHRYAFKAGLRRLGLSPEQAERIAEKIGELLQATLEDEKGRWVLQQRDWAKTEYPIGSLAGQSWSTAIIDRCFEEDDELWIVDYKVTLQKVTNKADYIEHNQRLYAAQLSAYQERLSQLRPTKNVRKALYLPAVSELVELK